MSAGRFALLASILGVVSACTCGNPALVARVDLHASSASRCVRVAVWSEDGGQQQTAPMPAVPGERRSVAIYQEALSDRVTVQAFGFAAASCAEPPDEVAVGLEGDFTREAPPDLIFLLRGEG